ETKNVLVNLRSAKEPFSHGRFDGSRTHCINPNSTPSGFQRSGLRQSQHSMFTRTVHCCSRRTDQTGNRRHVYNRSAAALLEHLQNLVLQAEPDALEIDVDGPIKVFFGLIDDWYPNALDPSIIEGDVQAAKFLHRLPNERINFSGFRDIGLHKQAIAAGGPDQ